MTKKQATLEVLKREILRLRKLLGIAVVLLLAASSARAQEQPNETYWHIISDSGNPVVYLQFAGLSLEEITKVIPVLAEYEGKYQNLR